VTSSKNATFARKWWSFPLGLFKWVKGEGDKDEEGPRGRPFGVTVAKQFALGRFVVTVQEYLRCVAESGCPPPAWQKVGGAYNATRGSDDHYKRLGNALSSERYPIVGVSWVSAQAYITWLNAKLRLAAGNAYRLPSEVEWERAARGGKEGLKYFWGNDFQTQSANAAGEFGADKWPYTSPVGSFPANAYGLYDMAGNVWQWVEDCYHLTYADMSGTTISTGAPWTSACDESARRVLRGGSWIDDPRVLRSADRGGSAPEMHYPYVGFRIARGLAR
jgi:formylglycine-generating enzyme required for sulfatase activity